jgi:hypothetical protein
MYIILLIQHTKIYFERPVIYTPPSCVSGFFGIIIILDINNKIHFINDTGIVVSSMYLSALNILDAERLFLDKFG